MLERQVGNGLPFFIIKHKKTQRRCGNIAVPITVDGVFLKADREMKKVFYELNEEKL